MTGDILPIPKILDVCISNRYNMCICYVFIDIFDESLLQLWYILKGSGTLNIWLWLKVKVYSIGVNISLGTKEYEKVCVISYKHNINLYCIANDIVVPASETPASVAVRRISQHSAERL